MTRQAAENGRKRKSGCPACGGHNMAACKGSVWCNRCDWIDPPEPVASTGDTHAPEDCTCAGGLIETSAHEESCAVMQERWSDPEYVALWESRTPAAQTTGEAPCS